MQLSMEIEHIEAEEGDRDHSVLPLSLNANRSSFIITHLVRTRFLKAKRLKNLSNFLLSRNVARMSFTHSEMRKMTLLLVNYT